MVPPFYLARGPQSLFFQQGVQKDRERERESGHGRKRKRLFVTKRKNGTWTFTTHCSSWCLSWIIINIIFLVLWKLASWPQRFFLLGFVVCITVQYSSTYKMLNFTNCTLDSFSCKHLLLFFLLGNVAKLFLPQSCTYGLRQIFGKWEIGSSRSQFELYGAALLLLSSSSLSLPELLKLFLSFGSSPPLSCFWLLFTQDGGRKRNGADCSQRSSLQAFFTRCNFDWYVKIALNWGPAKKAGVYLPTTDKIDFRKIF